MIPTRDTPTSPFAISVAVIGALLLRDMKTRAGRSFTGYFLMMIVPLAHLGAVIAVYHLLGRQIPVGNDDVLYLSLSVLPFIVFLYPSRQIMLAIASNKPLLAFPRVRILDLIIARGMLEFISGFVISIILFTVVAGLGSEIKPRDPAGVILSLISTSYLGFSIGFVNALISAVLPMWVYAFAIMAPVLWITSGIIFFPAAVPEQYKFFISLNPLLQCTEWIRYSWFENYPTEILNVEYLIVFTTCILLTGMILESAARRHIKAL